MLAAFLGGLALGAWALGPPIDRSRHPLRVYALLEAGIGLYALAFPFLQDALQDLYLPMARSAGPSWTIHTLIRAILSVLLLLPPTFLMGATLPAMCRVLVRERHTLERDLGRVYGYNTLGAAAGALAAGFILIAWLGLRGTIWFAAALNLSLAMAVAAWMPRANRSADTAGRPESPRAAPSGSPPPGTVRVVLGATVASGFTALGCEVLWTRGLITVLHTGLVYALSLMLASFLCGLVLGSLLYAYLLGKKATSLRSLGRLQLAIGSTTIVSVWILGSSPALEGWLVQAGVLPSVYSWASWITEVSALSLLVMLVPTTLMGIALPLSACLVVGSGRGVGQSVGLLYGFNTIGSVLGALVSGFVLTPLVGTLNSLALLASLSLASGAAVTSFSEASRRERSLVAAAAVIVIVAGVWTLPSDHFRRSLSVSTPGEQVYFAEDITGVAAIYEQRGVAGDAYRRLYVNGTSYASSSLYARRYHKLLGHLPALIHPSPERASP